MPKKLLNKAVHNSDTEQMTASVSSDETVGGLPVSLGNVHNGAVHGLCCERLLHIQKNCAHCSSAFET
jgi:hypothetical protein